MAVSSGLFKQRAECKVQLNTREKDGEKVGRQRERAIGTVVWAQAVT